MVSLNNESETAEASAEVFTPPSVGVDITPENSVVPVYSIPPDPEGIAAMQADNAAQQREAEAIIASRDAAATRLRVLGFTEDQISALMGPTPTLLL